VPFLASRDPVRNVAIIDARSLWACAYSPLRPCCLENLSRAPRLGAVGDTTCTSGFPLFVNLEASHDRTVLARLLSVKF